MKKILLIGALTVVLLFAITGCTQAEELQEK